MWPENAHEEGLEKFVFTNLFVLVLKPVRTSKPGRELTSLAIQDEKVCQTFDSLQNQETYHVTLEPFGVAGNHYHEQKVEIIYAVDGVELYFQHVDSGETSGLYLPKASSKFENTKYGVLVKPRVAHTIRNPSPRYKAEYTVLANMFEKDTLKADDIKDFSIDISTIRPEKLL